MTNEEQAMDPGTGRAVWMVVLSHGSEVDGPPVDSRADAETAMREFGGTVVDEEQADEGCWLAILSPEHEALLVEQGHMDLASETRLWRMVVEAE